MKMVNGGTATNLGEVTGKLKNTVTRLNSWKSEHAGNVKRKIGQQRIGQHVGTVTSTWIPEFEVH